jgi:hypothetical protein
MTSRLQQMRTRTAIVSSVLTFPFSPASDFRGPVDFP